MRHLLSFLFFLITLSFFAQTSVHGVVKDSEGEPIPFANVFFKNTNEGTITEEDGTFSLSSSGHRSTLVVSFVGYKSQEISLREARPGLVIILEEDASNLSEVVIYSGKTSKKDNPAIDILRKIWENRRSNGVKKFDRYEYDKYEKMQLDLNGIDSINKNSRLFKGMEFVLEYLDTSDVRGNVSLPLFINESSSRVYGDNKIQKEKEVLLGNKNSGFQDNHTIIDLVQQIYKDYDIYENYIKLYQKSFTSPLSRTGIDVYNYVLTDSSFIDNKWVYNIVFYPRRKGELTFKGDFWVNDTTWAITDIQMRTVDDINVNWVRSIAIEQKFKVLNDSVFLLTQDKFVSDFSVQKDEKAVGFQGKRTTLYDHYTFDKARERSFYRKEVAPNDPEVYRQNEDFWNEKRMESLSETEQNIYVMMDTLQNTKKYKKLHALTNILSTGYFRGKNFDYGPLFSIVGYNDVEGIRLRGGIRTFFDPNDLWRVEAYGAYGLKDEKFKYGVWGKWLLNNKNRLSISANHRNDVEQLGTNFINLDAVVYQNMVSSSIVGTGRNDKLSNLNTVTVGLEIEPLKNFQVGLSASYFTISSASETFNIDYFKLKNDLPSDEIKSSLKQSDIELSFLYTPKRKTSGYGVQRLTMNPEEHSVFYFSFKKGIKGMLDGDFNYEKVAFMYDRPWNIGGIGRTFSSLEMGKTFGTVPLSLLNPIPGNQTYFSIDKTFILMDYYEFISDTYMALHLYHDFGGRIFSRIPGVRSLNLREVLRFRGVYGTISENNININASDIIYRAPEDVYWEWSVGVGNIFRFLRVDLNFRGNYRDDPGARKMGVTGMIDITF